MPDYDYTNPEVSVPNTSYLSQSRSSNQTNDHLPLDREWARGAFIIGEQAYDPSDERTIRNRYWSSVNMDFTDTRIGGSIGLNPKPQFCPYSDIRVPDRLKVRNQVSPDVSSGNYGKGRYYGEAIDKPAQRIFIRLGFPKFTGLLTFLANAYDARMTEMATTGRGQSMLYSIAKTFGLAAGITAFPPIAILALTVQALDFVTLRPSSKFYTLKPAMHVFWSAVNNLVFAWMIGRGVWPKILDAAQGESKRLGMPFTIDQSDMEGLRKLMPDIFLGDSNYVDVFSVSTRAQRISNNVFLAEVDALEKGDLTSLDSFVTQRDGKIRTYLGNYNGQDGEWNIGLMAWMNKFLMFDEWTSKVKKDEQGKDTPGEVEQDPRSPDSNSVPNKDSWSTNMKKALDAQFRQGAEFVCLIVESTGQQSEGWSNSYAEPAISQGINSSVKQVRDIRFAAADGNIVGGIVGDTVATVGNAVKDVAEGAVAGYTFGMYDLIKGLAGSGFVDFPKAWESSQVKLNEGNYKLRLISPEPDVYSQLQNIYIPLFTILAMVMPLSVGKSAYRGPMICEVYDKGRFQSRLAAVTQVDVTRGTSTLPFNIEGTCLAIDVTVRFTDLSSIMHMPLSASGVSKYIQSTMDEDNLLMDYIAVLANQDIYSQTAFLPKAMIKLSKMAVGFQSLFSPYRMASAFNNNSIIGGFIENFTASSAAITGSTQPGR